MTKSQILKRLAKKLGLPIVEIKLKRADSLDLQGLPIIEHELNHALTRRRYKRELWTKATDAVFNENLSKRNPWAWSPGPTKRDEK